MKDTVTLTVRSLVTLGRHVTLTSFAVFRQTSIHLFASDTFPSHPSLSLPLSLCLIFSPSRFLLSLKIRKRGDRKH